MPDPGTHALEVSNIREPDLARLSAKVRDNSGPPFDGFQCSVSSAITNDASAPSAAVDDDVITSSLPSGTA